MFFRTQLLISTLLAVSSVLGAPSAKRNWGGPCERFPNGITNISGFRIAAHKPNNIDETWELVLKQTGIEAAGTSSTFTVGDIYPLSHRSDQINPLCLFRLERGSGTTKLRRLRCLI